MWLPCDPFLVLHPVNCGMNTDVYFQVCPQTCFWMSRKYKGELFHGVETPTACLSCQDYVHHMHTCLVPCYQHHLPVRLPHTIPLQQWKELLQIPLIISWAGLTMMPPLLSPAYGGRAGKITQAPAPAVLLTGLPLTQVLIHSLAPA